MWTSIIIAVIFTYFIYQLEKRVKHLEEGKGQGYSHKFSIDASIAFSKNKKFREMVGIKSASEGKEYEDWTKAEKDKWGKYPEKFRNRLRVSISYLASDNAYYISSFQETPYLIFRNDIATFRPIYSAYIAGDEQGIKANLKFCIYERLIVDEEGKREWVISPCIEYNDGFLNYDKNKFEALCDFPHFADKQDEQIKQLGFKIKRDGGDDIYEDPFGETHSLPVDVIYEKHGVEIKYAYR